MKFQILVFSVLLSTIAYAEVERIDFTSCSYKPDDAPRKAFKYEWRISDEVFNTLSSGSPIFHPPSLSMSDAIQIARKWIKTQPLYCDGKVVTEIGFKELRFRESENHIYRNTDKWCYRLVFTHDDSIPYKGFSGESLPMIAYVLFDGTIVEPDVEALPYK